MPYSLVTASWDKEVRLVGNKRGGREKRERKRKRERERGEREREREREREERQLNYTTAKTMGIGDKNIV